MKFYEFKDFPYYALIGAKNDLEAMVFYIETVADIEGDTQPEEITTEEAFDKLLTICNNEEQIKEEFEEHCNGDKPYLALIDKGLL